MISRWISRNRLTESKKYKKPICRAVNCIQNYEQLQCKMIFFHPVKKFIRKKIFLKIIELQWLIYFMVNG